MSKKKLFNPELETEEWYTEVWKNELIQVKDEPNILVRNHYWQDANGELWGDFDNPMENVRASFAAYRMKKGYMTPDEIRTLRHNLELSVRDFSDRIGIAPSSLTQIENDQRIQVKYQEIIFKSARDYYKKHGILPEDWSSNEDDFSKNISLDSPYKVTLDNLQYEVSKKLGTSLQNNTFNISSELGDVA